MNELRRAHYLDALGIDTYVPRLLLSGARPPQLCALPAAANEVPTGLDKAPLLATVSDEAPSSRAAPEANALVTLLQGALLQEAPLQAAPPPETPAGVVESVVAATMTKPSAARFSLSFWQLQTRILFDSRRPGDALPTEALLRNLLQALDGVEPTLPREEILQWPLVKTNGDNSWRAARDMVQAFVDGRLARQPGEQCWLFGRDAFRALVGEGEDFTTHLYAQTPLPGQQLTALVLPSLSDLLYRPELKKPVWLALRGAQRAS